MNDVFGHFESFLIIMRNVFTLIIDSLLKSGDGKDFIIVFFIVIPLLGCLFGWLLSKKDDKQKHPPR